METELRKIGLKLIFVDFKQLCESLSWARQFVYSVVGSDDKNGSTRLND